MEHARSLRSRQGWIQGAQGEQERVRRRPVVAREVMKGEASGGSVLPGVSTASWEVTGVLYRGGVIKLPRAHSALVFSPPQARKFWQS